MLYYKIYSNVGLILMSNVKTKAFFSSTAMISCPQNFGWKKDNFKNKKKFKYAQELQNVEVDNEVDEFERNLTPPYHQYKKNNLKSEISMKVETDASKFRPDFISQDLLDITPDFRSQNGKWQNHINIKGEILYGVHPVNLALQTGRRKFHKLHVLSSLHPDHFSQRQDGKWHLKKKIINMAQERGIPINYVTRKDLTRLSEGHANQGICLDAARLKVENFIEEKNNFEKEKMDAAVPPLWVVLYHLVDPMNVGAVIRSSYFFGVDQIFLLKTWSFALSAVVSKASSGALEIMPLNYITNLSEFIQNRKTKGWHIVSTAPKTEYDQSPKTSSLTSFNLEKPTVLLLGNEGDGLPPEVSSLCDLNLYIDGRTNLSEGHDSLNVSVAAGIVLHHLLGKREKS